MLTPTSGSKADEQLRQDTRRSFSRSNILSGRDAAKESKPMLSRKPASDPFPNKASKDPPRSVSIAPKVGLSSRSSESPKPPPQQEKKGFWGWLPFRAAAPPPRAVDIPQRFHVLYSLLVHSIQNLPSTFDGLRLIVHWNRQEEGLQTMPSRVLRGSAEFDETLRQRCTVFGSRNSSKLMQYEPKLFTLSVVALDADELELGKHHIDLSRLLPEADSTSDIGHPNRSWSTSFELSGMAKGSSLFVTFNYDLLHQETLGEKDSEEEVIGERIPTDTSQLPFNSGGGSNLSEGDKDGVRGEYNENAFQKGEAPNVAVDKTKKGVENLSHSGEAWDSQLKEKESTFVRDISPDLDEEVDLVAGEFLNMLDFGLSPAHSDSEGEPESPRARLLKQFEHEDLFGGELESRPNSTNRNERSERYPRFGTEELARSDGSDDGSKFASILEAAESDLKKAGQSTGRKSKARELEDEETQTLMQRWGMNENAFRNPPSKPVFGPPRPPPLGKGLGSILYLEDGGSLRSMNPSSISKDTTAGSLVMQSSKPVVVPSTIGSNAVDVLRHLASLGTDTLAKQAMTAMPLQDITGIADEVMAKGRSHHGRLTERGKRGSYDDYASLEDLAPLAMPNIEALAMDGLKIQADAAEEEAPSYLDAAACGILPETTKRVKDSTMQLSRDVAGMRFEDLHLEDGMYSDAKDTGPLSMALTLEEWSELDAGIVDDDVKSKERSLAIMAAHNADLQLVKGKGRARKRGNMGNTLMIAMLVQLRDPLQNFEPVGAPMLTLIQAERVMLPPKPKMGRNVSATGNSEVDDELAERIVQKEEAPQFKLTGVHMSGLKTEDDARSVKGLEAPKKGWGSQKQLQSGSRWLAAQGMAKASKPSLLKGKAAPVPAQTKVKPGETLWSISARVTGSGHKWRDLAALNPHIRNPDVIFANDTIRTK